MTVLTEEVKRNGNKIYADQQKKPRIQMGTDNYLQRFKIFLLCFVLLKFLSGYAIWKEKSIKSEKSPNPNLTYRGKLTSAKG